MATAVETQGLEKYRFRKDRKPLYEIIAIHSDVTSERVCMSQCIPYVTANSGVYNPISRKCQCTLMASFCRSLFAEKIQLNDYMNFELMADNNNSDLNMFIKMNLISVLSNCLSGRYRNTVITIGLFDCFHIYFILQTKSL